MPRGRGEHAALEAARRGERSPIARPRPTSSSESAQRRSPGAARADAADERARAEVVGLPGVDALLGAGGDEPDVAARRSAARPGASATSVPTPDALSSAPGAGGTVSACAMRIQRQSAGVSSTPITLRERPLPGTVKRSRTTVRPAGPNAAATALGAPLGRAGRGAGAGEGEVAGEGVAGVVGAAQQREGRGGGGEHRRQGTAGERRH